MIIAFFIGGFLFFWLIGSTIFKDIKTGLIIPIGIIAIGFILFFLIFAYTLLSAIL
jgi:hypothetical protein